MGGVRARAAVPDGAVAIGTEAVSVIQISHAILECGTRAAQKSVSLIMGRTAVRHRTAVSGAGDAPAAGPYTRVLIALR